MGKDGCQFKSNKLIFESKALNTTVVDKTGAGDCVTGVFGALKSLEYTDEDALQTAVNTATESIKEHGMFHLIKK